MLITIGISWTSHELKTTLYSTVCSCGARRAHGTVNMCKLWPQQNMSKCSLK